MQTRIDEDIQEFHMDESPKNLGAMFADQMDAGKANNAVIANMPEKGEEVKIRGLVFEAQQVTKSGNVILEPKGKKPPFDN